MIIRPVKNFITSVDEIDNLHELNRYIIIFVNDDTFDSCEIIVVNKSLQKGSIHAKQTDNETLYSKNIYYGEVEKPLHFNIDGKFELNRDAIVFIKNYSYAYKYIDEFKDVEKSTNYYSGIFHGDYVTYKRGDNRIILPSDPQFYNLDHQLIITDNDHSLVSDCEKLGEESAITGKGIAFSISDLIDKHTFVKVSKLKYDDPYNIVDNNDMKTFISTSISTIITASLDALVETFTCIFDYSLGYNIVRCYRSFSKIEKTYNKFEVAQFVEQCRLMQENLRSNNYRIRLTLHYESYQIYLQILPVDNVVGNKIRSKGEDVHTMIEDSLY